MNPYEALKSCIIYRCIIGSRVYGLSTEDSDIDERGVFLAPCDLIWSFDGAPKTIKPDGSDDHYWELKEFLALALAANPTALEVLNSPSVKFATPVAQELIAMRSMFLSRKAYHSYKGFVGNAFKALEKEYDKTQTYNTKAAVHMLRFAIVGASILRDAHVLVELDKSQADALKRIRQEPVPWQEICDRYYRLSQSLDNAYASTNLPEASDRKQVEGFLIRARRSLLSSH